MKKLQNILMNPALSQELKDIGEQIARMRKARDMLQTEAAVRANLSRETASRIENGDAAVGIGQVLRYLDVVAPGARLSRLHEAKKATLAILDSTEKRSRARKPSVQSLKQYDF